MAKVTNLTRSGMNFVVGVKDGVALTEHIKPDETRDINIDMNSATVRGRVLSSAIRVVPSAKKAAKVEPTAP